MQQSELRDRQPDLLAPLGYRVFGQVEREAAHLQPCLARARRTPVLAAAPEVRANTCDQFAMAERLGQVVVGAGLQSTNFVIFRVESREHDHGQRRPTPQLLEDVEPFRCAQINVEHDQVRMALLEQAQSSRGVMGRDRLQARPSKGKSQYIDQLAIVVNQQDPHGAVT